MDRNILNEELYRIKNLFDHQRGVVISEQRKSSGDLRGARDSKYKQTDSPNWKGRSKGDIDLSNPYGRYSTNVGYGDGQYTLTSTSSLPRLKSEGKVEGGSTPPEIILEPLNLSESSFPYPDNMIGPKFDRYPDANSVYEKFINNLSDFINNGGLNKITSIDIQGTADSARPTLDVPSGYSKLDHDLVGDSQPYGGEKDDSKRNQYLADNRAKVLGNMIVSKIKKLTEKDITDKIKILPGINYYGQSSKRGETFKKVTVTPNYSVLKVPVGDKPGVEIPQKSGSSQTEETKTFLDLTEYGSKMIPAKIINQDKGRVIAIDRKISDENNLVSKGGGILPIWTSEGMNGKSILKGEIKGDEFFADGISFGKIVYITPGEVSPDYESTAESTTRYITKGRPVVIGGDNNYDFVEIIKFAFSEL